MAMNSFAKWEEVPIFDSESAEADFWAENRPDLRLIESAVANTADARAHQAPGPLALSELPEHDQTMAERADGKRILRAKQPEPHQAMKLISPANEMSPVRKRRAFTLIEMLVVIAIMGVLAAMIIPLAGLISKKKILSRARIEVDNLALAIDTYKLKKGSYPPDNATAPAGAYTNQLFYELWGMILQNPNNPPNNPDPLFTNTFSAKETIDANTLKAFFGTPGIINSSPDPNEVFNFISRINAGEIQNINTAAQPVWVFATPATGPLNGIPKSIVGNAYVNTIRYVSSNPTNNQSTYDLWVDVIIGGVTNRISNWNKDPEKVGY